MTWTTPQTFAVDEELTAAKMNTNVRDNLTALAPDGDTSASWTPAVAGTSSGLSDAANAGREYRIGPLQFAWAYWTNFNILAPLDGAIGTYELSLPAASANITANGDGGTVIGSWRLLDASPTSGSLSGVVYLSATQSVRFGLSEGLRLTSTTISPAAGDMFSMTVCYPVA